ncbi:MAG: cupredoxin family copper-binding protein [Pseudomonadota bacterium]|jgi:plastocyanin
MFALLSRPTHAAWLTLAFAVSLAVAICHPANATSPAAVVASVQVVQIKNFAFVPAIVTVAPGTTVTWTNVDEDPHSVVANDKGFRSSALDTQDRYSFTFTKAGDYAYFCSLHPHMTGKIIVKPR